MADTVTSTVLESSPRNYVLRLTCISDGTGESAVAKVTKANLVTMDGQIPSVIKIKSCRWNIQGFSYVKLAFDHTAPDTVLVLSGNGYDDWTESAFIKDPASAGGTGNLTLSSVGAVSGATYDITLVLVM